MIFIKEELVDLVRPLNELLMGLSWIPDYVDHIIFSHPLN